MTTVQIECAIELARRGNFSRAAESLFISQPTLSRNILMLEDELGVTLFLRQKHSRTLLTPEGEIVLEGFRQAMQAINGSLKEARRLASGAFCTLRLGMLEGQMVDDKLCAILNAFLADNPRFRLEIVRETFHSLLKALAADEVDVITTLDWELRSRRGITIRPLYKLPTILVIPKSAQAPPEQDEYSLKDFAQYPFVYVTEQDSPWLKGLLLGECERAGFRPKLLEVDNMTEQITQLEMGSGVAGLNPFHSVCSSPNVRCVNIREFEPQQFSIAWKANSPSPAVSAFERWYNSCEYFEESH